MSDKGIASRPFFNHLADFDEETCSGGFDTEYSILPDEDSTVGLSFGQDLVTITKQYYGSEEVTEVYMTKGVFEKLYRLYLVHKGVMDE